MFYYYEKAGKLLASERRDLPYLKAEPAPGTPICYLVEGDPVLGRGSFKVNCPGQLRAPHGLEVLDASRLPDFPLDAPLSAALEEGMLTAVNTGRAGWEQVLSQRAGTEKKRVNILAIGDVGSTLLTGLKLLGGDVISSIGICDLSDQITARWEFEMGQISLPWDYGAFPEVEVISLEKLFDCDVFVFVASRGIPPVGSQVKDVRMAQFENNAAIVKQYARMARAADFQGLWCAVSDPVDPWPRPPIWRATGTRTAVWDGKGLRPEQIQGFGLGVMNARAAYYAKQDEKLSSFLTEGRSFGPYGTGLWIRQLHRPLRRGRLSGADPENPSPPTCGCGSWLQALRGPRPVLRGPVHPAHPPGGVALRVGVPGRYLYGGQEPLYPRRGGDRAAAPYPRSALWAYSGGGGGIEARFVSGAPDTSAAC